MTKPDLNETELDALFDSARRVAPLAEPGFLKELERDALLVISRQKLPAQKRRSYLADLLGGWRGMGGLAVAGVTGLWIGVSPPSVLPDPLDFYGQAITWDSSDYDPMFGSADFDELFLEDGDDV